MAGSVLYPLDAFYARERRALPRIDVLPGAPCRNPTEACWYMTGT
ncbi:MAG: hypothetical protein M5U12_09940 [Verrucomicrobia bacterium]|nr:hypothetical protein [Verrucomicrobiota bacterium]